MLLVLAYLFVYHVVEHTLILDILNLLIARFGEVRTGWGEEKHATLVVHL